jgi:hypothetical protein
VGVSTTSGGFVISLRQQSWSNGIRPTSLRDNKSDIAGPTTPSLVAKHISISKREEVASNGRTLAHALSNDPIPLLDKTIRPKRHYRRPPGLLAAELYSKGRAVTLQDCVRRTLI